ncbi:hypothetical protein JU54_004051 [Salmonella enterica subsp. enterica serovar Weslaco]|nr:hypothetical protein [Salmonella enterica subsp. enterica serovar Weslaco]
MTIQKVWMIGGLAATNQTRYLLPAPAKSGAGLDLLNIFCWRHIDAPASFFMSYARLHLNGGLGGGTARCAGCQQSR